MTEASAYVVEEIEEKLESSVKMLLSALRKSRRSISGKKDLASYEQGLEGVLRLFDKTVEEYPEDQELKKIVDRFSSFYSEKGLIDEQAQKEKLSNISSDLKSLIQWRKLETAHGRTLGFSDFRSLRSESKKR
ncbi:hypothetical protein BMS3Abin16_01009 [archaeon BMS3Abin16]|nr:hypothetical protein BMS3Abin16_01009 [archaeon BMS3Abin16]HDY73616.1 hypothetical protein [Euryarchaeota archaeon]